MRQLVLLTVAAVSLPVAGFAQLLYPLQQERFVHVRVPFTADDPNQPRERSASAANFAVWQADVCMESVRGPAGSANQYSEVTGDRIEAYGSAELHVQSCWPRDNQPLLPLYAADSYFRARFAVPEPVTFDLVGYISVEIDAPAPSASWEEWNLELTVAVNLNRIAGNEVYAESVTVMMNHPSWQPDALVELPLGAAGELAPGVYELTADATLDGDIWWSNGDARVYLGQASYVVSAEFAAPPPVTPTEGDLDGDGDVDIADFARLQAAFSGPMLQ